jgi:hypothetical protein
VTDATWQLVAFLAGCGATALLFLGWNRDLRRYAEFWRRRYLASEEERDAIVDRILKKEDL